MSREFDLSITEDHIRNGVRGSRGRCPIALAFREAYPDATEVFVEFNGIRCYTDDDDLLGLFAGDAVAFMGDFDAGHDVEPLTIHVTFPFMEALAEEDRP